MARSGRFAAVSCKAARIKISLLFTTLLSSAPAFVYAASAEIPMVERITDNYIILAQNTNGGYLQDSPYRVRRVGEATPQRHPSEPVPSAAQLHQKALEMRALQERAIKTEPVRAPIVDTAPPPPKAKAKAVVKAAPRRAPARKAVVRKASIIRPQPEINTDAAARALEADLLRELQAAADNVPEAPKMLQTTEQPVNVSAPESAMIAPKNVLRMPVEKLAPAMEPEAVATPKTMLVIEPAAAPSPEEVPAPKNVLRMPVAQPTGSGILAPRMIERKLSEVPAESSVLAPQMPPVIRDTRPAMSSEERARNMLFGEDEPEAEVVQEPVQETPKVMRLPAPKMATTRPLPQKHQGPSVIIPQVSPRAALVNPEDTTRVLQPVSTRQITAKAIEEKLREALKDKIIEEKAVEKTAAMPLAKPVAKAEKEIIAKPSKAALKPKVKLSSQPVIQPRDIQATPVAQKLQAPPPQKVLTMPELSTAKPVSQSEPTKIPLPQPQSEPVAVEPRAAAVPSVSPAKPAVDTPLNESLKIPTLSDELPSEMNQNKMPAGQGAAAEPPPSPAAQKITNALNALRQKIRGNAAPQQIPAPSNADEVPVTPEVVIDGDDDTKVKLKPLSGVYDANGQEIPVPVLELASRLKQQAAARENEPTASHKIQIYTVAQQKEEESLLQELQQAVLGEAMTNAEEAAAVSTQEPQVLVAAPALPTPEVSDAEANFLQNAGGGVIEEAFVTPAIAAAALVTEESTSPDNHYQAAQPTAEEPAVKVIPISMKAGDKPFSSWSKQTQKDLAQLSVVAEDVGLAPIKLSKVTSVIGGGTEVSAVEAPEPEMIAAQLPVSVPVYPDAATQKITPTERASAESGDKTVQTLFITPTPVQEPIRQTIPGSEEDVVVAKPIVPVLPVPMADTTVPEEVYQPKLSNESKALLQRLPSGVGSPLPESASEPFDVKHLNSSSLEAEDEVDSHEAKGVKMQIARPNVDVARYLEEAYQAQLKEDLGTAMDRYQAVVEAQPNNVEAKFGLATTYHRMGELVMARNLYAEIIQIQPNYLEALNNLLVLVSQESPEEALVELKKLEQKNPQFSPIPAQMAALYARNEDFGSAIESIQRAMSLDPNNLAYRYNAAVLMDRAGRSEEAIELYVLLKRSHERGQAVPADMAAIQERLTFLLSNRG